MTDENQKPAMQEVPKATPADQIQAAMQLIEASAKALGMPVVIAMRQRNGAISAVRLNASVGDAIGLTENASILFTEDMRAEYVAMKALDAARKQ